MFKYNNCTISWNSAKQKTVSLSSTEAEYIALASAVKEAVWLKQLLEELGRNQEEMNIFCDNKSTICLANNPEFHTRTKHIDIRYHYIRETIINNSIAIVHIPTVENISDVLTKGLDRLKHFKLIEMMGLKKIGKTFTPTHSINLISKSKSDTSANQMIYKNIKTYKDQKLICQKVICKLRDGVESLEINL